MTKVKICGITRTEDAIAAARCGADYLGFVFVKGSKRFITPEGARRIRDAFGEQRPLFVGVFRDAPLDEMRSIAEHVGLDVIQMHGRESDDDVRAMTLPVIKAFDVRDSLPMAATAAPYVMFDTGGGTGRTFDWSLLETYARTKPFFVAGGITPDNVGDALRTGAFAIDLASGVESAPGIKDHEKLERLFKRVKR